MSAARPGRGATLVLYGSVHMVIQADDGVCGMSGMSGMCGCVVV
jgi:hypothetical protein